VKGDSWLPHLPGIVDADRRVWGGDGEVSVFSRWDLQTPLSYHGGKALASILFANHGPTTSRRYLRGGEHGRMLGGFSYREVTTATLREV
jgi:hypothetical protein